jgi:hypothetical protein
VRIYIGALEIAEEELRGTGCKRVWRRHQRWYSKVLESFFGEISCVGWSTVQKDHSVLSPSRRTPVKMLDQMLKENAHHLSVVIYL